MGWVILLSIVYLLGLFTEEMLGPRSRVALERARRVVGRRLHDDPVPSHVSLRADLPTPVSGVEARSMMRATLDAAGVRAYEWSGDTVAASVTQSGSTLGVELRPILADPSPEPIATGTVRIGGIRVRVQVALTYRLLDETLADVNALVERLTNALARQGIVADLASRTLAVEVSPAPALGVSTLTELRQLLALMRATSLTLAVKQSHAHVAFTEHDFAITGELDSAARAIARDAILFGSPPRPAVAVASPPPCVPGGGQQPSHP